MSNSGDIINLVRDILNPLGIAIYKLAYPVGSEGTERIELNSIPVTQARAGTMKQNNDVVNVNLYVPKTADGRIDSGRIATVDALIQNAIEAFNGNTTRVGYSYLDIQPSQTFNESEKESLTNIRIETTYT